MKIILNIVIIIMNQNIFIKNILSSSNLIKVEDRDKYNRFKYGIENHAEFLGMMNPYDKCLWDAIIPGYKKKIPKHKIFQTIEILGMLWLEDGNHKVAIKINYPGFNYQQSKFDIQNYIHNYLATNSPLKGKWISANPNKY
jgi:hypothetical protein